MAREKDYQDVAPRDRIIVAAERLFAAKGLHGAGLREIAREASVNVNLINWHFKNKDELYVRIHEARAAQINAVRQRLLDEANARAAPQPPSVRDILYAFVHPFFELKAADADVWVAFIRSYMREVGTDVWRAVNAGSLAPAIAQFTEVLHRSLPAARRADIVFILGMAIHAAMMAADPDEASMVGENLAGDLDTERLETQLIDALTAVAVRFA